MKELFLRTKAARPDSAFLFSRTSLLVLMISLGVISGSLIGTFGSGPASYISVGDYCSRALTDGASLKLVFKCALLLLFPLLFSTSYLGGAFICGTAAYFGFVFSKAVSWLFLAFSYRGYALAAMLYLVPALVAIPFLLFFWEDCILQSLHLFDLRFGRFGSPRRPQGFIRHFLFAFSVLLLTALYYLLFAYDLVISLFS